MGMTESCCSQDACKNVSPSQNNMPEISVNTENEVTECFSQQTKIKSLLPFVWNPRPVMRIQYKFRRNKLKKNHITVKSYDVDKPRSSSSSLSSLSDCKSDVYSEA